MSKTLPKRMKFDGCPVPWCTTPYEHGGEGCCSDIYNVHGVNIGTRIGAWISTEESGDDRPVVYLGLTGLGDKPADGVYLDVDELRDLARAAHLLADSLEAGHAYVVRGVQR